MSPRARIVFLIFSRIPVVRFWVWLWQDYFALARGTKKALIVPTKCKVWEKDGRGLDISVVSRAAQRSPV